MTALWAIISAFILMGVALLSRLPLGLPDFIQEVVLGWLSYILIIALVLYVMWSFLVFLALGVRRIHDIGLSGWWIFIGLIPFIGAIVVFVFTVIAGNASDNKYGSGLARSVAASPYSDGANSPAPLSPVFLGGSQNPSGVVDPFL